MIKKIIVKNPDTNEVRTVEVGQVSPESAERIGLNESGNMEISSKGVNAKGDPQKVNLNSVGDIQIKPGDDSIIQIDNENNFVNPLEVGVKFCNGTLPKAERVAGAKINVAEIILDTQNANTTEYDPEEMHVKFRSNKKDHPIYAKLQARAFDIRCNNHGGIALQIAGKDSSNHENKIKFESDRASAINETALYTGEGGKGLEFGTFNNLHTSIFTGDYRFKADGYVYAVTRGVPELVNGKFDYPTQDDDFKDILDESKKASWEDIINAAKEVKTKTFATESFVITEINNAKLGGGEGGNSDIDLSIYATKEELENHIPDLTGYLTETSAENKYVSKEESLINAIEKTGSNNLRLTSSVLDVKEVKDSISGEVTTPGFSAKLNLESNGGISLKAKNSAFDLSSSNVTIDSEKSEASLSIGKISLANEGLSTVEAEKGLNLGITPTIVSVGTKISTKGKLEGSDLKIQLAYLNNNANPAYLESDGKVHIPYELKDFYVQGSTVDVPVYYDPAILAHAAKTAAFATPDCSEKFDVTPGYYYIKSKSQGNIWVVECEVDSKTGNTVFKKVNSEKPSNHGLLSELEGFENTVIEPIDYVGSEDSKKIEPLSVEPYASVKLSDLLGLVERVNTLESRLSSIESLLSAEETINVE